MASVEEIKRLNMVELLTHHYRMTFRRVGGKYASLSPFTGERNPSFFVRQDNDGHWLFKDFSSGNGGSIIDFVLLKEGCKNVSEALLHIRKLLGCRNGHSRCAPVDTVIEKKGFGYDIEDIYRKVLTNDQAVCRKYLAGRGIAKQIIDDLTENGILLHNHHKGHSYCCFAVFNQAGNLCCLDNHQIDGEGKFVLGKKDIFTRDWDILSSAERVFACEGIIDYLSIKTLNESLIPGIALLGNIVHFDTALFKAARVIISALDADSSGLRAFLDLQDKFPDKEFLVCNLGECKDPNEHLQALKAGKEPTKLTPKEKLDLYKEFMRAENKSEVAMKWGINRSYMYQIVKECEQLILSGLMQRRPGRKPEGTPVTLEDAIERLATLEEEKLNEAKEKERFYARSEFLKVRLKWAEFEAAQLRGEPVGDSGEKRTNKQIKKKRRKR